MKNAEVRVSRVEINSGWTVREIPRDTVPSHRELPSIPAQVPGHIHLDLMRAGVIPDPFFRMHERDVEWVDETDWVYETSFTVEDDSGNPAAQPHRSLLFHGLDTIAEVTLNGKLVGSADNMLIPHRFEIDSFVQPGENALSITFRSALNVGMERKSAFEAETDTGNFKNWDSWAERSFVRKAQYMYGWDWGPTLRSCGVWQPVELVSVPVAELLEWKYDYLPRDGGEFDVTISAVVRRYESGAPLTLAAALNDLDGAKTASLDVPAREGVHSIALPALRVRAQSWQPNGIGAASRYKLQLALTAQDTALPVDEIHAQIGFRTVELLQEPDADGSGNSGFLFRVNGNDVFAKGANWIPDDSFPARVSPERLRERLTQAQGAGFNMLRIWGGGFYESELFYDICDELGIMVWQDFLYVCAYYPDQGAYADAARVEAVAAVKRIRNHPSLALWCGNNENDVMYHDGWGGSRPPRYFGEPFYQELLPRVVAEHDPSTPYWASSPSGGEAPNSDLTGDCHNWDVWHGRGDWTHYVENDARFCSEFGFASSCGMAVWDENLAASDKSVYSNAVRWHDKTRKDYNVFLDMIALHYPQPQSLDDHVYYSQCNQADAMKFGVEHYRRRKGHCWGTLIWQLNDCWPVQSWAMIDSSGEPKAAYYAAKNFYAPVLLSLLRGTGDAADSIEAHVVNDRLADVAGILTISLLRFDGAVLARQEMPVTSRANTSAMLAHFSLAAAAGLGRSCVMHATLTSAEESTILAENVLLLDEPKSLELSTPKIRVTADRSGDNQMTLTIVSDRFAPYTWLSSAEGPNLSFSDNFVHLLPGVPKIITVAARQAGSLEQAADAIVARTMSDSGNSLFRDESDLLTATFAEAMRS